jgi:hypothetical protein
MHYKGSIFLNILEYRNAIRTIHLNKAGGAM